MARPADPTSGYIGEITGVGPAAKAELIRVASKYRLTLPELGSKLLDAIAGDAERIISRVEADRMIELAAQAAKTG